MQIDLKMKLNFLLLNFILIFIFEKCEPETIHPAPFFKALAKNLFPSLFLPLIATNKLSFFIVLVSIEIP